jgi:hypothetical protein
MVQMTELFGANDICMDGVSGVILLNSFLAYFQKMKVGLSNHQPVRLCPTLITFELIGGFS